MSEFFIELFSEEIPANLQNKTRQDFFQNLKEFLEKEEIIILKVSLKLNYNFPDKSFAK